MIAQDAESDRPGGTEARTVVDEPKPSGMARVLRAAWHQPKLLAFGLFWIFVLYGVATNQVKVGDDLIVSEIRFGPAGSTLQNRTPGASITCLADRQERITAFVKVESDGWGAIDDSRAAVRLIGRTNDNLPLEVIDVRRPLGQIARVYNTGPKASTWVAFDVDMPRSYKARTLTRSATIDYSADSNRANDTRSGVVLVPCA